MMTDERLNEIVAYIKDKTNNTDEFAICYLYAQEMAREIQKLRSALSRFTEEMPRSETVESLEIDAGAFGYRDLISWLKKVTSTPCLCQGGYNPDCPSDHGSVPIAQGEVGD